MIAQTSFSLQSVQARVSAQSAILTTNPSPGTHNPTSTDNDKVTLGGQSVDTIGYTPTATINDTLEAGYEKLRQLVTDLLTEQGVDTQVAMGEQMVDITRLSPEGAQELIAENGYFGVKQTSERIVQFAIGVAGNDPSRIDAIREGIDRGFQEAEQVFGGQLPDISYDTYDAIMKKLDDWVSQAIQKAA